MIHQIPGCIWDFSDEFFHVSFVSDKDQDGVFWMSRLQPIEALHGVVVGGVARQPPNRVGGMQQQAAFAQHFHGLTCIVMPRFRRLPLGTHVKDVLLRAKFPQRLPLGPGDLGADRL